MLVHYIDDILFVGPGVNEVETTVDIVAGLLHVRG